jgi:hypothetical protein
LKLINDINFYILEVIAFALTVSINLLMIIVLTGEGEVLYGDDRINYLIKYFGYINFLVNLISTILWLIAKFKLLYMTECQKMLKNYEEQNNEEDVIISLSLTDKLIASFNVLIRKNKLLPFFWNMILSIIGSYTLINSMIARRRAG